LGLAVFLGELADQEVFAVALVVDLAGLDSAERGVAPEVAVGVDAVALVEALGV
jgi:hypothetical protein